MILLVLMKLSLVSQAQPVMNTYFLDVSGDEALAEKLIADLTSQECHYLPRIGPAAQPEVCHTFKKYENLKQLTENSRTGSKNYRYTIAIDKHTSFTLQLFIKDGGKSRRTTNAGEFRPKGDFYESLLRTTKLLVFK